jgi:hypothetical protein
MIQRIVNKKLHDFSAEITIKTTGNRAVKALASSY